MRHDKLLHYISQACEGSELGWNLADGDIGAGVGSSFPISENLPLPCEQCLAEGGGRAKWRAEAAQRRRRRAHPLGRFTEGRSLWGLLINESRAMASRVMARVPSPTGGKGVRPSVVTLPATFHMETDRDPVPLKRR